jgi:hypothetical protein
MKDSLLSLIVLAATLHLAAIMQKVSKISSGEEHYLRAKHLIENNCIDCMGSTRAGMEQGIQEVQAALAAGFADQKAAYKLLADAYNAMITFSGNDVRERESFMKKERAAVSQVYRLDPGDSEFAVRYADTLKDKQEKLTILRSVAERDPSQADAAFGAGLLLIDNGKLREGLQFISKAITNQKDSEGVANYANTILEVLQNRNCPFSDAEAWRQKFIQASDKAIQGDGDPTEMLEVKKQFLARLEKHACQTNA